MGIIENDLSRRTFLKFAVAAASFTSLAAMGPVSAFADSDVATIAWPVPTGARPNTVGGKEVLKCYATSTNTVLTETLGLSNPSVYQVEYTQYAADLCTSPTFGTWGSAANSQPNAFISNLIYESKGYAVDSSVVAVKASALQGTSQQAAWDDTDGVPLLMKHRPQLYGITSADSWGASRGNKTTADFIKVINSFTPGDGHYQDGDENYNPTFVDFRKYYGQKLGYMYSMWEIAEEAEKMLAADSTKCARYGSPSDCAANVERFMVATQYSILRAIETGQTRRKIVAVAGGVNNKLGDGVDVTNGRIRIDSFDASTIQFDESTQWGSTTNYNVRYYHAACAMENCCDNVADILEVTDGDLSSDDPIVRDSKGILWARPAALMECDAVIIRATAANVQLIPGTEEIFQLMKAYGYTDESEWPDFYTNYPTINGYGASNCGCYFWWYSYLLFAYPEVINPVHMSAYLFETVYHLASSYLDDAIEINCGNMSLPTGYELSIKDYSAAEVDKVLNRGIEWYLENKDNTDTNLPNLKMTSQMQAWLTDAKKKELGIRSNVVLPVRFGDDLLPHLAALEIDEAAFTSKPSTLIVVKDAVAACIAAPLAKLYKAAIITVPEDNVIDSDTAAGIKALGASNYLVVGTTKQVPVKVESALKALGLAPIADRVTGTTDVALSVAAYKAKSGWGKTAIVASTKDLVALQAVTSYAYKIKAPIFIVGTSLTAATKAALKKFTTAIVLGSTTRVSKKVANAIPCKVTRWTGTAYALAKTVITKELAAGMTANNAIFVVGETSNTGFAAGAAAGNMNSVVVPVSDAKAAAMAAALKGTIKQAYVLGSVSEISAEAYEDIVDAINA